MPQLQIKREMFGLWTHLLAKLTNPVRKDRGITRPGQPPPLTGGLDQAPSPVRKHGDHCAALITGASDARRPAPALVQVTGVPRAQLQPSFDIGPFPAQGIA